MAKKIVAQQAMPGLEAPPAVKREYPPAQRAVMAYCRGWKSVRATNPPKQLTGQVARAAKQMIEAGRSSAVVIEAAERCGQKGYGATGLGKEVGDLEARRAAYDSSDALARMNRRGL